MNIRWRLGVLAIHLILLGTVTYVLTGQVISTQSWSASLLAVILNPLLLEPWFAKPQDVVANVVVALAVYLTATRTLANPGWIALLVVLGLAGGAAIFSLVVGANRKEGRGVRLARNAQSIARIGTAKVLFSAVFWLSLIEAYPDLEGPFWPLGLTWAVILVLSYINWQSLWAAATNAPIPCAPDGMIGPSILRLTSTSLPQPGTLVRLHNATCEAKGLLITRIQRPDDAWGEVFIAEGDCRDLVRAHTLTLDELPEQTHGLVGSVDAGSSDRALRFVTPSTLKVGQVVAVSHNDGEILYQISYAEVDQSDVRGGGHLIVRARASQLGQYHPHTGRIERHQWVPEPGRAVRLPQSVEEPPELPEGWVQIGNVSATSIPVYMNMLSVTDGHLSILGMTRMGKTSFAAQLAIALADHNSVMILDQTGEYVRKRGFQTYSAGHENENGLVVFEPRAGQLPARRALECLEWLLSKATAEYDAGAPRKRVLILEEAHQFVPEPAGLGFNAPGRDEAYQFGLLMMQIRKFGLSAILISQRTAVVAKSALSQCENIIAFKSVDQTGLDYLQSLMGDEARTLLPSLTQGQAIAFGPAMSLDSPVVIDVIAPNTIVPRVQERADPVAL